MLDTTPTEELDINWPPMISFNTVDAAGSIGSRNNVVKMRSNYSCTAGTRAVKLGGGIVQALIGELPAAKG